MNALKFDMCDWLFDAIGLLAWWAAVGGGARAASASGGMGAAHHRGLVLLAVAVFILADRPGISAVLWTTAAVLAVLLVLEIFVPVLGIRLRRQPGVEFSS
jgi:hypothetical protein